MTQFNQNLPGAAPSLSTNENLPGATPSLSTNENLPGAAPLLSTNENLPGAAPSLSTIKTCLVQLHQLLLADLQAAVLTHPQWCLGNGVVDVIQELHLWYRNSVHERGLKHKRGSGRASRHCYAAVALKCKGSVRAQLPRMSRTSRRDTHTHGQRAGKSTILAEWALTHLLSAHALAGTMWSGLKQCYSYMVFICVMAIALDTRKGAIVVDKRRKKEQLEENCIGKSRNYNEGAAGKELHIARGRATAGKHELVSYRKVGTLVHATQVAAERLQAHLVLDLAEVAGMTRDGIRDGKRGKTSTPKLIPLLTV
eukprot:1159330-Pelagomonas_calceolata.AAC.13